MRSYVTSIIASILLVLCVGGSIGLIFYRRMKADSIPQPPPVEFPERVGAVAAEPIQTRASATAIGTVLAPRSIQIRTELVGTISKISFSPGQTVEEGAELLQLDTSVEQAQLASAKAMQRIAESTYKRSKQAAESRAISELELEQSEAALAQSKAEVQRLEAIIAKKTIKAPFRAKSGIFDLHPGQYLPEGTTITMLQSLDSHVNVDFMMPQHVADFIKTGDCIEVISSDATKLTATIIAIDSQADRVTRNVMARARLNDPPPSFQPNDSVKIEMEYGPTVDNVKVPYTAIRNSPTGAFVYVAQPDENDNNKLKARPRQVVPGRSAGQWVTILKGVQVGETVITDGSFKLREGMWVAPENLEESKP